MGSSPTSGTKNPPPDLKTLAYITGVAIGDGNLSNPNGRATRLRVTCDTKYPELIKRIISSIRKILPDNKVSIINRAKTFIDISCYSNKWEGWLDWKANLGPKHFQSVSIPTWIKEKREYSIPCLRGLLETDGSIYSDRGYKMVNFVTVIPQLASDVMGIISKLGFEPRVYKIVTKTKDRYNVRISKCVNDFIKTIGFSKT